jgi:hypothetical protein
MTSRGTELLDRKNLDGGSRHKDCDRRRDDLAVGGQVGSGWREMAPCLLQVEGWFSCWKGRIRMAGDATMPVTGRRMV